MTRKIARSRALRGFLAIATALLTAGIAMTGTARADVNCEGQHCYSIAYENGSDIAAVDAAVYDDPLTVNTGDGDGGAHLNSEYWLIENNQNYLEAGLRYGFDGGPITVSGGCGCVAYDAFWAEHENVASGNDTEFRYILGQLTSDGNYHTYAFVSAGQGDWLFGFDGNLAGISTVTGDTAAYQLEAGAELQNTSCASAAASGYGALITQLENSSGTTWSPTWNGGDFKTSGCDFQDASLLGSGDYEWSLN